VTCLRRNNGNQPHVFLTFIFFIITFFIRLSSS